LEQRLATFSAVPAGIGNIAVTGPTITLHTTWDIPFVADDDLMATEHVIADKDKMNSLVSY
jgi:hypothetical protein